MLQVKKIKTTRGFDILLTKIINIPDIRFILLPFFFFLPVGHYLSILLQASYILISILVLKYPSQYSLNVSDGSY